MKQRRRLLTEPSPPQARSSRRRCDPGLRHSLTETHGPVEVCMTVAPGSSLHESLESGDDLPDLQGLAAEVITAREAIGGDLREIVALIEQEEGART